MSDFTFKGLMAATVTPFDENGSVNLERITTMQEWEKNRGVAGFFVCGTTGEGPSLTVEERMSVAEISVKHSPDLPVVVHVGANAILDCIHLAQHADEQGADAIASAPPSFFKPGQEHALECAAVTAGAAPSLPYFYYHIPSMSGVALDMERFVEQAIESIPNFAGVKYTHEDLDEFGRCVNRFGDQVQMLFGRDELLLDSLKLGAVGAVGSTYNYASSIYLNVISAFEQDNLVEAERWQKNAVQFIDVLVRHGGAAATKMFMTLVDMDCGNNRLPLKTFDEASLKAMKDELVEIGFFDWVKTA